MGVSNELQNCIFSSVNYWRSGVCAFGLLAHWIRRNGNVPNRDFVVDRPYKLVSFGLRILRYLRNLFPDVLFQVSKFRGRVKPTPFLQIPNLTTL